MGVGLLVLLLLQKVIGMAVRAGMLFAALSLAKTSPHRRPVEMMLVLIWVILISSKWSQIPIIREPLRCLKVLC
jgi:hypothetical protein